jgi:hypothetical protein
MNFSQLDKMPLDIYLFLKKGQLCIGQWTRREAKPTRYARLHDLFLTLVLLFHSCV